jgi:hypothetical protein
MSGAFDNAGVEPGTLRGREWPCLRQFCVFLENRVGRLNDLLRHVERDDLRVLALSVVDTVDFAVTRLVVNETDRAREILQLNDFTFLENDVLGVELSADSQPLLGIFRPLVSAELNVNYIYPLLYRRRGRGAVVVHVDNLDQAAEILRAEGHRLLRESDLVQDDEFL